MKQEFSEIHIVGGQLSSLRKILEASYEHYPTNADFATSYVTLCTAIEYVTGFHLRTELEALRAYTDNVAPDGLSELISRSDLHGNVHPYDQSRAREALLRLLDKEILSATRLTYEGLCDLRKWICGDSLKKFCDSVDNSLCSDLKGLFALRHMIVHGRPLRLDTDENSHNNSDAANFSLKETVKTLSRIELLPNETDVGEQTRALHDAIFSCEAIEFYWNRVGDFAHRYVTTVPHDLSYHKVIENVLTPLKPLR